MASDVVRGRPESKQTTLRSCVDSRGLFAMSWVSRAFFHQSAEEYEITGPQLWTLLMAQSSRASYHEQLATGLRLGLMSGRQLSRRRICQLNFPNFTILPMTVAHGDSAACVIATSQV